VIKTPRQSGRAADGPSLQVTLDRFRRALDDWIELAQEVRTAALRAQPPPAETLDDWLRRVRSNNDAISDAIVWLWWRAPAPAACVAARLRSEQLLERLIQSRIATIKEHFLTASGDEVDTAVDHARRRGKRLSPDAQRRLRTIAAAAPAFFTLVLPGIVRAVPSFTRRDMLWWIERALPGTRGGRGGPRTPMFDDVTLLALHDALREEHPDWGRRAAVAEIAERLVVDPKTVELALGRATRVRKNP
jgi:hypothetical protein